MMTGPWSDRIHVAETITVSLDLNDPDVQALDLRNSATPGQAFLAVEENGTMVAAGPIWTRKYNRGNRTLELGAAGAGSYFDHRLILPLLALTIGTDQWTVPDPTDPTKTMPNPLLSTTISGVSLGTIVKRALQQASLFPGGTVPLVFQDDEISDSTRTYLGADFKPVWEAINDIMNVQNGPEVKFQPRRTADGRGVEWLVRTGTVAQPLITSPSVIAWDVTVPESPVLDLDISEDASKLGSLAWQVGGRQADDVLVSRAYDPTLVTANFPLLELVDSSHSTVSVQSTLDSYALADVLAGRTTSEIWSFSVKAYPTDSEGNPSGLQFGSYAVGDFCDLVVATWNPDTGFGDPYITGGTYRMRIIGLSGDEHGVDVKIDCAPLVKGF
ncbi:hypothetical protein [Glaciihabitans sp. UYNi722]|uniref:hypothetical protein n=1 Tax=Glaciihabitans sp. UYNi722 TaxID=3156344 RepID=UPI00339A2B52